MPRGLSDSAHKYLDALVLTCLKENPSGVSCQDIMIFGKTKRAELPKKTGKLGLPISRIGEHLRQLHRRGLIEKGCKMHLPYNKYRQIWRLKA